MGRKPWSRRQMIEDCRVMSILDPDIKARAKSLYHDGYFRLTVYGDNKSILSQQDIHIRRTAIFGKLWFRYWFSCPQCHNTVQALYWPRGARSYECRICHDLTYRSQKKRNGFQERWLMQYSLSRRDAWQWLDELHGRKKGLPFDSP